MILPDLCFSGKYISIGKRLPIGMNAGLVLLPDLCFSGTGKDISIGKRLPIGMNAGFVLLPDLDLPRVN